MANKYYTNDPTPGARRTQSTAREPLRLYLGLFCHLGCDTGQRAATRMGMHPSKNLRPRQHHAAKYRRTPAATGARYRRSTPPRPHDRILPWLMSFYDSTRRTTGFLRGPTGDEPNTTKGGRATAGAYGPIKCGQVAGAAEGSATAARDTASTQDPGAR